MLQLNASRYPSGQAATERLRFARWHTFTRDDHRTTLKNADRAEREKLVRLPRDGVAPGKPKSRFSKLMRAAFSGLVLYSALTGNAVWSAARQLNKTGDLNQQIHTVRTGIEENDPWLDWRSSSEIKQRYPELHSLQSKRNVNLGLGIFYSVNSLLLAFCVHQRVKRGELDKLKEVYKKSQDNVKRVEVVPVTSSDSQQVVDVLKRGVDKQAELLANGLQWAYRNNAEVREFFREMVSPQPFTEEDLTSRFVLKLLNYAVYQQAITKEGVKRPDTPVKMDEKTYYTRLYAHLVSTRESAIPVVNWVIPNSDGALEQMYNLELLALVTDIETEVTLNLGQMKETLDALTGMEAKLYEAKGYLTAYHVRSRTADSKSEQDKAKVSAKLLKQVMESFEKQKMQLEAHIQAEGNPFFLLDQELIEGVKASESLMDQLMRQTNPAVNLSPVLQVEYHRLQERLAKLDESLHDQSSEPPSTFAELKRRRGATQTTFWGNERGS